jgi:hypothetical protein
VKGPPSNPKLTLRYSLTRTFHREIDRIAKQHPDSVGYVGAIYRYIASQLSVPARQVHASNMTEDQLVQANRLLRKTTSRDIHEWSLRNRRNRRWSRK